MARPKAFDTDAALLAAMRLFWEQGYEATSMADLVEALGVNRASLYDTYGSKHDLFLASLDRYETDATMRMVDAIDAGGDPVRDLETVLRFLVMCESGMGPARGCLMVNTALEFGGRNDAAVESRVASSARTVTAAIARLVARGQAAGEIRTDLSADVLAHSLFATVQGLRVAGRSGAGKSELDAIVDAALIMLAPP